MSSSHCLSSSSSLSVSSVEEVASAFTSVSLSDGSSLVVSLMISLRAASFSF
jgi:hypothetical protein